MGLPETSAAANGLGPRRVPKVTVDNIRQLAVELCRDCVTFVMPRLGAFPPLTWPRAQRGFFTAAHPFVPKFVAGTEYYANFTS
jgi:hypothetical protein